jgi:hypothetical protein
MAIQSVVDFLRVCFDMQRETQKKKPDNILFFRGQIQEHKSVVPSIYQKDGLIENEDKIYHEIIAEFPDEMSRYRTTIEKQIFMQHYELPTRILDVSRNPLVSLFFACYKEDTGKPDKEDGVIYVYSIPDTEIKFCDSDSVTAIINLCKCPADYSIKNIQNLSRDEFNEKDEITRLIHFARDDKPFFANVLEPDTLGKVLCIHPAMNNTRIIRQDGYFFVFGIDGEKKNCAKIKDDWNYKTLKIPCNCKQNILAELELLNINAAYLFADFMHIGIHLRKKYGK